MNNSVLKENQKVSVMINISLLILVILMGVFYYLIGARIFGYYSIFVSLFYIFNFFLISRGYLTWFIWVTYAMLTAYMGVGTVLLGINYGFNLYAMSTIPLIFSAKYVAVKIGGRDPKPVFWSILIILSCLGSSIYSVVVGSYYNIGGFVPVVFLGINIASVCFFLVIFSRRSISLVIKSEELMSYQANHDALTDLPNRYSLKQVINKSIEEIPGGAWIAMLDIDNFKKINDRYGHNGGDSVLKSFSSLIKSISPLITPSRWGGEEFLIYGRSSEISPDIIEKLRMETESLVVEEEGQKIRFTVSGGVCVHEKGLSLDKWIITADDRLYEAKKNGKNRIVFN